MFFISWGARDRVAPVGEGEVLHCSRCAADTHWTTYVQYRLRYVYWLFRWTTGRTLYRACGQCGAAEYLDDAAVPRAQQRAAIPFLDRRGWAIGAGVIASLVGLGTVAAAQHDGSVDGYLRAPQAGDVYEANLARLMDKPPSPVMYGALRVAGVTGDAVELEVPDLFYESLRGVQRDVSQGRLARSGYFRPERMKLARSALAGLYASGVIADVER